VLSVELVRPAQPISVSAAAVNSEELFSVWRGTGETMLRDTRMFSGNGRDFRFIIRPLRIAHTGVLTVTATFVTEYSLMDSRSSTPDWVVTIETTGESSDLAGGPRFQKAYEEALKRNVGLAIEKLSEWGRDGR
jgi:hypothetical protein